MSSPPASPTAKTPAFPHVALGENPPPDDPDLSQQQNTPVNPLKPTPRYLDLPQTQEGAISRLGKEEEPPGYSNVPSEPLLGDVPQNPPPRYSEERKRPVSYPWGPEVDFETPHYHFAKRNSDPPRPGATGKGAKTQVKPFTKESLEKLERKTVQLVREYGFQPRRKLSVEDGSRLPAKYEPFPSKLYGRPLEEIDNFIYDEVD